MVRAAKMAPNTTPNQMKITTDAAHNITLNALTTDEHKPLTLQQPLPTSIHGQQTPGEKCQNFLGHQLVSWQWVTLTFTDCSH